MVSVRSEMALATAGVPSAGASIYSCVHTHAQVYTRNITSCQFNNVGKKHTRKQHHSVDSTAYEIAQLDAIHHTLNNIIELVTAQKCSAWFLRLHTFMNAPERRDICLMNEPPAPIRAPTDELGMLMLMVSLRPLLSGAAAYCCCC